MKTRKHTERLSLTTRLSMLHLETCYYYTVNVGLSAQPEQLIYFTGKNSVVVMYKAEMTKIRLDSVQLFYGFGLQV